MSTLHVMMCLQHRMGNNSSRDTLAERLQRGLSTRVHLWSLRQARFYRLCLHQAPLQWGIASMQPPTTVKSRQQPRGSGKRESRVLSGSRTPHCSNQQGRWGSRTRASGTPRRGQTWVCTHTLQVHLHSLMPCLTVHTAA